MTQDPDRGPALRMDATQSEIERERRRVTDNACLTSLATSEPCRPHAADLRRCTICGFVVDVAYEATSPSIKGSMVGRPSGSDNPDPTLVFAQRLQSALRRVGIDLADGPALAVARELGR